MADLTLDNQALKADRLENDANAHGPSRGRRLSTESFRMSERRACRAIRINRSTIRYETRREDATDLRARLRELAQARPRFRYRRLPASYFVAKAAHQPPADLPALPPRRLTVRRGERKRVARGHAPILLAPMRTDQALVDGFIEDTLASSRDVSTAQHRRQFQPWMRHDRCRDIGSRHARRAKCSTARAGPEPSRDYRHRQRAETSRVSLSTVGRTGARCGSSSSRPGGRSRTPTSEASTGFFAVSASQPALVSRASTKSARPSRTRGSTTTEADQHSSHQQSHARRVRRQEHDQRINETDQQDLLWNYHDHWYELGSRSPRPKEEEGERVPQTIHRCCDV